ncbi:Wzz/FepE/Etk N-terminal domain-containing protein [Pseudomonas sp. LS44]|uniref:LPS O-antigen chain length determinant protein WzzB n=1 Tax=Pseudomonas sp. LS44 TaxID=1357074 RepID=UPI00215AC782|nr:Wzz/FepE/Etk N-terminal domain-containing protein [Pseudomonas sp. LS44]UVE19028.1 Wzz/FepE/Etk N-terminal domain-containing protein [Pseudomonas sp. LS44]
MSANAPTPVAGYSDEIDLLELVQSLWKQKLLISLVIVVVMGLAASYAFLSVPVYESKSSILPPRLADIAAYNMGRSEAELPDFTVEKVYSIFTQNLRSDGLRREFFEEVYLPAETVSQVAKAKDQLWENFNNKLSVSNPDMKNSPQRFAVTVQSVEPGRTAEWANMYVERAANKTRQDMADTVAAEISARVRSTQSRISVLRESARKLREDRIARLSEALMVADKVALQAPQVKASRTSSDGELKQFVDGNLMYMRGAKAIRAELDVLQNRKNDDPFITDLRKLENKLDFLAKVSVSPDGVEVFTLDSAAEVPETPIKPRKALILALGLVLGGMLGVFIALIRGMLAKRRESIA